MKQVESQFNEVNTNVVLVRGSYYVDYLITQSFIVDGENLCASMSFHNQIDSNEYGDTMIVKAIEPSNTKSKFKVCYTAIREIFDNLRQDIERENDLIKKHLEVSLLVINNIIEKANEKEEDQSIDINDIDDIFITE